MSIKTLCYNYTWHLTFPANRQFVTGLEGSLLMSSPQLFHSIQHLKAFPLTGLALIRGQLANAACPGRLLPQFPFLTSLPKTFCQFCTWEKLYLGKFSLLWCFRLCFGVYCIKYPPLFFLFYSFTFQMLYQVSPPQFPHSIPLHFAVSGRSSTHSLAHPLLPYCSSIPLLYPSTGPRTPFIVFYVYFLF